MKRAFSVALQNKALARQQYNSVVQYMFENHGLDLKEVRERAMKGVEVRSKENPEKYSLAYSNAFVTGFITGFVSGYVSAKVAAAQRMINVAEPLEDVSYYTDIPIAQLELLSKGFDPDSDKEEQANCSPIVS